MPSHEPLMLRALPGRPGSLEELGDAPERLLLLRAYRTVPCEAFRSDGGNFSQAVMLELEGIWNGSGEKPGELASLISAADAHLLGMYLLAAARAASPALAGRISSGAMTAASVARALEALRHLLQYRALEDAGELVHAPLWAEAWGEAIEAWGGIG